MAQRIATLLAVLALVLTACTSSPGGSDPGGADPGGADPGGDRSAPIAGTASSGQNGTSSPGPDAPAPTAHATGSPDATTTSTIAPLTVDTTSGRVRGVTQGGTSTWLGVRYAEPPTGERRWTDPEPARPRPGVTEANRAGAACVQRDVRPGESEDCLFVNVTTPREHAGNLPVMVWWHGGGFVNGSGADYDARRLAEAGQVMVVTVNYRLGVFGYLALPGLPGGGDFGLADQILATRWARDNAAAFGGDPGRVTVFGESAGAMSVCAFLTTDEVEGLVQRAAMSSGDCGVSWPSSGIPGRATPYVSLRKAQQRGLAEARRLGCTNVQCLRTRPTADLKPVSGQFLGALAYGTPLLPEHPATARSADIPVLSSVNRDEGVSFVSARRRAQFTGLTYPSYLANTFPGHETPLLARYPVEKYSTPGRAWTAIVTDSAWACPTHRGNVRRAKGNSPVYAAEFAGPDAQHAADLPYLFDRGGFYALKTPAQRELSATMIGYWSSFARTGVPSAEKAAAWPAFTGDDGPTLLLRTGRVTTTDFAAHHHCGLWDKI
ncbi:carboxylesterase/lipase family protein [Kineosporia succinea]|uniref:Carboxylic ester hydrolase n=1 Tax=Kineosporia succinea TaxID=84632 RepID=A0ABT9P901_9ACTN|nr:carboxylesterase family protein [Kineosporia succinea]MDP9829177.1 para-nitrobenzyl esterase [Kineosporia succinea]